MARTRFRLEHDGDGWFLCWDDAGAPGREEIDCDAEPGGSWTRGDCMGELVHFLPAELREPFTQATKALTYPATLEQVNGALAALDD